MDLGLYNMKYPFRKILHPLLQRCKNVNPNHVSLLLVPIGAFTGIALYAAGQYAPEFYILVILLLVLRMVVGTLDGLLAEELGKCSSKGALLNRLTPEIADVLTFMPLILIEKSLLPLGVLVLGIGWLTSFCGLFGATAGAPTQSVGPVGQTDRVVALLIYCGFAYYGALTGWASSYVLLLFLLWLTLGGVLTILLRLHRTFQYIEGRTS